MSIFHTLRQISQIADKTIEATLFETGLTRAQFLLLEAIATADGPVNQNMLVSATGIDRSTLSDIIVRLISKKLISRKRDHLDTRAYRIHLTDTGRAAYERAAELLPVAEARLSQRVTGIDKVGIVQQAAE